MGMGRGKSYSRRKIKAAIPGSGGIIAEICRRTGYAWGTVRDAINSDPELLRMMRDEEETIDDIAENVVIKKITGGDETSAKWWLARRRRQRYGDNVDVTSGYQPLDIKIIWHTYDDSSGDSAPPEQT
jgi:hypothetical protein